MIYFWAGVIAGWLFVYAEQIHRSARVQFRRLDQVRRILKRYATGPGPIAFWRRKRLEPIVTYRATAYFGRAYGLAGALLLAACSIVAAVLWHAWYHQSEATMLPINVALRIIGRGVVPLGFGLLVGIMGFLTLRRLMRRASHAAELVAAGALVPIAVTAMLVSKDPEMSLLSGIKTANLGGVSLEFTAPQTVERDVRNHQSTVGNPGNPAMPLHRIGYSLNYLAALRAGIVRDRNYARQWLASTWLDTEAMPAQADLDFVQSLIEPTIKALQVIHSERQSHDIWWVADRELIASLRDLLSSESTSSAALHRSDFKSFEASMTALWRKICDYEKRRTAEPKRFADCEASKAGVVASFQRITRSLESDEGVRVVDRHHQYWRLVTAASLFMANEAAAALALLHPAAVEAEKLTLLLKSSAADLDLAARAFEHYRASNFYFTILQLAETLEITDAALAVRRLRLAMLNQELGAALVASGTWYDVHGRVVRAANEKKQDKPCNSVPGSTAEFKLFVYAHMGAQNNFIYEASRAYDYVKEARIGKAVDAVIKELTEFPIECLIFRDPDPDAPQLLPLTISRAIATLHESVALYHLQVAADGSIGARSREAAVCSANKAIGEASTALDHVYRPTSIPPKFEKNASDEHNQAARYARIGRLHEVRAQVRQALQRLNMSDRC